MEKKYPIESDSAKWNPNDKERDATICAGNIVTMLGALIKNISSGCVYESIELDYKSAVYHFYKLSEVLGLKAAMQGIGWVTGEYDRLYDQLKAEPERKIVCWVNYEWGLRGERKELLRDICSIMGRVMGFNARGIGYGGSEIMIGWDDEREYFLEECNRLQVQWLDEGQPQQEKEANP